VQVIRTDLEKAQEKEAALQGVAPLQQLEGDLSRAIAWAHVRRPRLVPCHSLGHMLGGSVHVHEIIGKFITSRSFSDFHPVQRALALCNLSTCQACPRCGGAYGSSSGFLKFQLTWTRH